MSTFKIKCETFLRLASVCEFFSPKIEADLKEKLNVIRLENVNGIALAIVTNQKIAVVEHLGKSTGSDERVDVVITEELVTQCEKEAVFDSYLTITTIPEIAVSSLQTTLGFTTGNCCRWFDDTPLNNWRNWGVENPPTSSGIMYWNLEYVQCLLAASPSGKIIFPEFIDATKPLTLRDYMSPEWVGLFLPQPPEGAVIVKQSELPEWWYV